MKRLDRFILKSFFGPFVMTFFITVFILVMQFLWLYIDELVGKGLSFWVIMEFLGWGSATILPLAMPLATLLASIMTFGNLGENNELLAMKAAGISLQRIFYPLIYVAFFISVAAFFVSNNLIPLAYNKIYTLQYDIARTKDEIKIPTGTFYNGIDGYSLRVNSNNKETGMMYDVMIYNHTKNKGNISLAVADSGMIRSTPDKKSLVFTLYHGVSYEEDNTRSSRDTSYKVQQVEFDMQEVVIALENYAFQKSEEDRYGNDIMARNLEQLHHDRDSLGALYDEVARKHRKEVTYDLYMDRASQLDTSKNKNLGSNFPLDTLGWFDTQRELEAVEKAITTVQRAVQTMQSYDREVLQYTFFLRRIDLESLRKFTLSFACFIFFFIGAPLGAIIRKGGLGTPVIVSALFFVLYWVVDISGKKLARDGVISPELGAFISSLVLLPIGVFLTWKSTKDSSIFNIETYLLPVKKFFAKMSKRKHSTGGSTDGSLSRGHRTPIVFMGTPEFAVESLKALVEGGYNVVGVVTVPDRKAGRGQKLSCSPVKEYALSAGLPVLQPESMKDPDFERSLREWGAEIFVVVAFRMLPKAIWSMPALGTFNLHASLLPAYRGAAPINWAVINGETESGVTTFLLDEHIDTGSILFQDKEPVLPEDSAGDLYVRLMTRGAALVLETVDALVAGTASPVPQSTDGLRECQLYAPKLSRETGHIRWENSAVRIHDLIRGLSPRPGAWSVLTIDGREVELKIYSSSVSDMSGLPGEFVSSSPGTVYTDHKSLIMVRCGEGVLSLGEIQAPGKKRMQAASFLAGWRGEQ
ncbi:MAG TPA: methionyl-tRNA formyltransferase [Candidatus Coprenecus stercoravium]|uniref:Methionyl-tRNA formyltransferase n=1 Tax=Candidatus Coprenecus stercoravium TaxID=2840735 RepID=A0A9D2GSL4_9BACT|nr:methionyl-tRNA formyltransferase [Candidatus Coprenecus stercoravium]